MRPFYQRAALLGAAIVSLASVAAAQTAAGYHVVKKIPVGGEGGWGFVTLL